MQKGSERGEGRLQSFVWLAFIGALIYAGWNVLPAYIANYSLADKLNQIARSPRGSVKDEQILDMIMKEVNEENLGSYIQRSCFRINTAETNRRISCEYERTEKIFPGVNRTFRFKLDADQPVLF